MAKNDFDKTSIRICFRLSPYQFNQLMQRVEEYEKRTNADGLFPTRLTSHEYAKLVLLKHLIPEN